jgi:glucose-6-phosphate 1-epimerase
MEGLPMRAAELASRFRIAGAVEFTETKHGLVKATILEGGMTGELFLQGGQVTSWQPSGARPVIFTSPNSNFAPGKAIRGGIPIIFPWFGPHPTIPAAAQHGYARTAEWQLVNVERGAGAVTLELSLSPENLELSCRITFGRGLQLSLTVENRSAQEVEFEEAFHTYFAVSDVEHVTVSGLEACPFIDKTATAQLRPLAGTPLSLTKETDSVYLNTPESLTLHDPDWQRRIVIGKPGAASTIVWNPWPEKAAGMADLGAANWRGFVCIEAGNVADNRIRLPADGTHEMHLHIAVDAG